MIESTIVIAKGQFADKEYTVKWEKGLGFQETDNADLDLKIVMTEISCSAGGATHLPEPDTAMLATIVFCEVFNSDLQLEFNGDIPELAYPVVFEEIV